MGCFYLIHSKAPYGPALALRPGIWWGLDQRLSLFTVWAPAPSTILGMWWGLHKCVLMNYWMDYSAVRSSEAERVAGVWVALLAKWQEGKRRERNPRRTGTRMGVTEALCCAPETNTAFSINYTPIQSEHSKRERAWALKDNPTYCPARQRKTTWLEASLSAPGGRWWTQPVFLRGWVAPGGAGTRAALGSDSPVLGAHSLGGLWGLVFCPAVGITFPL